MYNPLAKLNAILQLTPFRNLHVDPATILVTFPVIVVLAHAIPYFIDRFNQRAIPGPLLARFSDVWLGWVSSQGHRSDVVHELHNRYGAFVRIAPNHVSIADPDALQVVYAHGNGCLKSDFYDAFVSVHPDLLSTRNRADHARKRKIMAQAFSERNVSQFEPSVRQYVGQLFEKWDHLCDSASKGDSGTEGHGWVGRNGRMWVDCLPWIHYLAFDIIGDLALASPFGMITNAKDSVPVAVSQKDVMDAYGSEARYAVVDIPAVQILNDRGDFAASIGVLPPRWRPYARLLPWYHKGGAAMENLTGMAVAAIAKRLNTPTDRTDLLSKLQEGRDDEGKPMGREELTAESLTQLIAGSATISNSTCAITYHVARNPWVQEKLQKELDEALGDARVSTSEQVKHLPYLEAVINEGLRVHSTSSMGLPRVVPEGGLTVNGMHFPQGTVLSVPTYTIHRDKEVWGEDADIFRPERWFEGDRAAMQKAFNPFSFGPRSCIGRNLASMELLVIISSIFHRYDFVLAKSKQPLDTREGFLRKVLGCEVGIKRRR
ncbi:cytochrome P450 [Leucogyrophana mollusca]|uniref:Cytochrome P450 n=1 Tax=Leucogyrophana mollusca TaxID=85980 RepID=A0ACB8B374_9AGAM|nr:cytochrome P450 [Leucogyrophana mollusca]